MKKGAILILMVMVSYGVIGATGFYAVTNNIGYEGTIWNITDGTGSWATSTPRDAALYTVVDVPGSDNYNCLLSNWSEHHVSNQNNSFFQLYDNTESVTSASGDWDASLTTFTCTVSGQNAPYPWSRFWQPDNGVAWGVTLTEYTYTFTATFSAPAAADSGGYMNSVDPDTIVGTFSGQFVVTADVNKNPITDGDLYGFEINFSKDLFVALDTLDAYGNPTSVYNQFGTVPEPATMAMLLIGGAALLRRKRA